MEAWWRNEPLSSEQEKLLNAVFKAHYKSSFRPNPSSVTVAQTADSSGDLSKAIAAGLLSLGAKHAPLEQTIRFLSLDHPEKNVAWTLETGEKVPGWGGAFQKDGTDPIWHEVDEIVSETRPDLSTKLFAVTVALHEHGKQIFPNPSAYTACAAIAVGLPANLATYIFILGRLTAWTQIAAEHLSQREAKESLWALVP